MSFLDLRWRKKKPQPAPADPPITVVPVVSQPLRITDERDGELLNRTYSYWSNAFYKGEGIVYLFVGHADGQPRFFKSEGPAITRLGPLLGFRGTGEGMYWTANGDVMCCDGPRLHRVNPFTGDDRIVMDISHVYPDCRLWQAHSSDGGTTHSATVERIVSEGAYPRIGTAVDRGGELMLFAAEGVLDESHLDASGQFLIIEEDNGNRIIDLATREERRLTNAEGALSHVDCGSGFMVGEDDIRGACTYLNLRTLERRELFQTWNQGVVSVKGGRCIVTDTTHVKEVALDGSGVTVLAEHGMIGSGYDFTCRANLDPLGRVAMWLSNSAGRMDAYLLSLP